MATENNIKHFSAEDIERYHKGLLSTAEMHAMEKAAMDDPFLADALEGYGVAGVNVAADITELKNRLQQKTGSAKLIPLESGRRRSFQLLRVAVLLAFIAGAGILIYQLGFNNKSNKEVAQLSKEKTENKTPLDSIAPVANATQPESAKTTTSAGLAATETKTAEGSQPPVPKALSNTESVTLDKPAEEKTLADVTVKSGVVTRRANETGVLAPPASGAGNKPVVEDKIAKTTTRSIGDDQDLKSKNKEALKDEAEKNEEQSQLFRKQAAGKTQKQDNFGTLNSNTFRGRVTDNNNVGVPFANVTNPTDNAGTYTDARGYFNLTYPDSVLNIQVKSIGFQNRQAQLRNDVSNNQVVLDNDRNSLSEVVVNKQKINSAARNRDSNMKLEEPEPADGWDKYDAYLLNNNNLQDDAKEAEKSNGAVLLSFEVNKNGVPTNIKVEKSLCDDCDKEAIRLIKQGPKWKRNAKKGRTTITVPFNKN